MLRNSQCDIFGICETFFRGNEEPEVHGYKWIGNNRKDMHKRANRGSGDVGAFIKDGLYDYFDITPLDKSKDDIIWMTHQYRRMVYSKYALVF